MKNCQIRPTAIRNLKRGGLDDRYIATVSKHKVLATLREYDPVPEMSTRFEGAQAIMSVKNPKTRVETVTTETITKKVSKSSIIVESNQENQARSKILHQCQKCEKYFGSFGIKNHPCQGKEDTEKSEKDQNDSFEDFLSQAKSNELNGKPEDSFEETMSQLDENDYIDVPESPKSKVQNWMDSSESESKKPVKKFKFKKRKLENSVSNLDESKKLCNDPFRVEIFAHKPRENYVNSNPSFNEKILQAQQAHERQKLFTNFFQKEQEIQLELLKHFNKK